MKVLKKLSLKEKVHVLNEEEMKKVLGGGSGWCCFSNGECVLTGCTANSHCTGWYGEGWCN
jgi:hypothetical protein